MRVRCMSCGKHYHLGTHQNKYIDKRNYVCSSGCLLGAIKCSVTPSNHPAAYAMQALADENPGSSGCSVYSHKLRMTFRSYYEARVCEWLNMHHIHFEYEHYRFELVERLSDRYGLEFESTDTRPPVTWMPDLYLPHYGVFLEIKGIKGAGFTKKLTLFRQQIPFEVILVHWGIEDDFPAIYDPNKDFFGGELDARY